MINSNNERRNSEKKFKERRRRSEEGEANPLKKDKIEDKSNFFYINQNTFIYFLLLFNIISLTFSVILYLKYNKEKKINELIKVKNNSKNFKNKNIKN